MISLKNPHGITVWIFWWRKAECIKADVYMSNVASNTVYNANPFGNTVVSATSGLLANVFIYVVGSTDRERHTPL